MHCEFFSKVELYNYRMYWKGMEMVLIIEPITKK